MNNVTVETKLTINLTADDWQLYDKPGRDLAAAEMNERIQLIINRASDANSAIRLCSNVLDEFDHFGASDTEGRQVLCALIRLRFPAYFRNY